MAQLGVIWADDIWNTAIWNTAIWAQVAGPPNNAPTDIQLSNNAVLTTGGVNAIVGTLSTTDADVGDTFTYSLVAGAGDTNNADFSISGANLRCDDPSILGVGSYSIRIQTSDGTDTYAKAFSISVLAAQGGLVRNLVPLLVNELVSGIVR